MADRDAAYRQLVERSPDAVIIGREGRVVYVNPAAVQLLGYRQAEELLGAGTDGLVHPEDLAMFHERRERALRGEENPLAERRIRRADGSYLALEGSLVLVDFDGAPAAAFIGRDSQGKRRVQDDFHRLVESVPAAVAVHRDGRFVYLNPAAVRILGYQSAGELIGTRVIDLVVPEDRESRERAMAERMATGAPRPPTLERLLRRDGSSVLLIASAIGIEFEGKPARLMLAQDLTEQHAAGEQLRALIDSSPFAVLSVGVDLRVLALNPSARKLFDWDPPHELLPENRAALAELCELARERGSAEAEREVPRLDGSTTWLRVSVAPLRDARGEVTGYVALACDISAMRAAERQRKELEQSLRRAEAVSAMGALVAGVAHEVRNPLFAMSATLDAIEVTSTQPMPERLMAGLRLELDRINRLVSDLLDYGKPPAPELSDEPLAPVLRLAALACQAAADKAAVTIESAAGADPCVVPMNAPRLMQVFQNLLQNAVQYAKPGQTVRIECSGPQRGFVEVAVLDRGPGFRPEDLAHVFEPFFSRRAGGTGLGLSIVQRIVEQHRGTVTAGNRDDGGARVVVRLPCRT